MEFTPSIAGSWRRVPVFDSAIIIYSNIFIYLYIMSREKPLDLDIKLKPVLKYKWGNEEGFRNFKKGYEKGFNEAQEILIKEIKQRIKSAVQRMIQEIREKTYDRQLGKSVSDVVPVIYPVIDLEDVLSIIKKYFPDEVKENER